MPMTSGTALSWAALTATTRWLMLVSTARPSASSRTPGQVGRDAEAAHGGLLGGGQGVVQRGRRGVQPPTPTTALVTVSKRATASATCSWR